MEEKKPLQPKELEKEKEKKLEQQISKFKEVDKEVHKIEYEEYDEEEEYAVIDVELSSEQDIYRKFSMLSRKRISLEIMNHIEDNAKYVPLYKPLLINVTLPHTQIEKDLLTSIELMVERSLIKRINDLTIQLKQVRIISSFMVIFGLAAMTISVLLAAYVNIFMVQEIFTISSWVFIWKAVESFAFDQRKLSAQKYKLLQIYSADYDSRLKEEQL